MHANEDYSDWKKTAIDYTFNPFRASDTGQAFPIPAFTLQAMNFWRSSMGSRGVIGNHGLNIPINPAAVPVLSEMQHLGGGIEFQTAKPQINLNAAVQLGITSYRATEFEMWDTKDAGGPAKVSLQDLQGWADKFQCGPN